MDGLEGIQEDFGVYYEFNWEPVESLQDMGNVLCSGPFGAYGGICEGG